MTDMPASPPPRDPPGAWPGAPGGATGGATGPDRPWTALPDHRDWLRARAGALWSLFEGARDPAGGFFTLDAAGRPRDPGAPRAIHDTTRMVHSFALAELCGRPGAGALVDHGLAFLRDAHRDPDHGGYAARAAAGGTRSGGARSGAVRSGRKMAYGHAFVLLAASSALVAGHGDARALLDDVAEVLDTRFWEDGPGAMAEEFEPDWTPVPGYRGQNANMHMVEALMAAFEATGEGLFLDRALRIAELIVDRTARAHGWRLAEHFDEGWRVDRDYDGDPMFRPGGLTPGHGLEWARLLVQLHALAGPGRAGWAPDAARGLFDRALSHGWDRARGGLVYTVGWDDAPRVADRYWWPVCEGIGAAHALGAGRAPGLQAHPEAEGWYRRMWDFAALTLVDRANGGWHPQIDARGLPAEDPFFGKPDIYHALQACLVPLFPVTASLSTHLAGRG